MAPEKSKRIVFDAPPEMTAALEQIAGSLNLTKIGTIRLAVAILTEIVRELSHGGKLVLRDADGRDRELWLPQLNLPGPQQPPR
jgi:hypothetical protein